MLSLLASAEPVGPADTFNARIRQHPVPLMRGSSAAFMWTTPMEWFLVRSQRRKPDSLWRDLRLMSPYAC